MKTKLLLIGSLLAFLVATGATWVMAQNGETILACASKDGTLRIIAHRDECKQKETIYEWYAYTVVDTLLGAEAADRLAADVALQANIDAEAAARSAVDGALQSQIDTMVKADPPCFDNTNRYVDCGNGTVHDTVTNLIWLRNASCYEALDYAAANNAAAGLEHGECGLTDGSSPGDWRLPTKEEWETTVARAGALACEPALLNTPGNDCISVGPPPFTGFHIRYWSSTTDASNTSDTWFVSLRHGVVGSGSKESLFDVWPVRGGQ